MRYATRAVSIDGKDYNAGDIIAADVHLPNNATFYRDTEAVGPAKVAPKPVAKPKTAAEIRAEEKAARDGAGGGAGGEINGNEPNGGLAAKKGDDADEVVELHNESPDASKASPEKA